MTPQTECLRNFLIENLEFFERSRGSGAAPEPPKFELYARDYLAFAERELEGQDKRSLINCIGHLKRAMDCQLDAFLHTFGLGRLFQKRNLKIEKKLEFLDAAGVFTSRTLSRLNTIRNRMEHSYEVPKIHDLEVYFDLVVAFVSVLERAALLTLNSRSEFNIVKGDEPYRELHGTQVAKYGFVIDYNSEDLRIAVDWEVEKDSRSLSADSNDYYEFAYFFRVFVLLAQREAFASDGYLLSQF